MLRFRASTYLEREVLDWRKETPGEVEDVLEPCLNRYTGNARDGVDDDDDVVCDARDVDWNKGAASI
jgi:hypothetical protein